ncbi:MAG: hypothetical protein ACKOI0_02600 [Actinomycetota bacterium]
MSTATLAAALIGLGGLVVAWVITAGRPRVAERAVQLALGGAGVAVAAGGLLLWGDAGAADWALATVALGLAFPTHFRWVFREQA